MVYKGNIQFSSPQFAKKFKQALMGPKIDKIDSYDAFDVLKKIGNKLDNKFHIKSAKHKFKKGDFVEVMRKYRTKVDEEYKNKYHITEYDVDPGIKEKSDTAKGKHMVSAIPYKVVKAETPLMSMPSVVMPIYSDKGKLRLKKLGKRDIKNDKHAQNLLTKIKEKKEEWKRLRNKKSVKKAKSYKHSSKGKKIRDAGVTHMGDMASANLTLRAMENLAKMNGGKKSKYNVKMARKFRRTRRKRGRGEGMSRPEHIKTPKEICQEKKEQIEARKNYQSDFSDKIKKFLPQFKELKKELDESQARVTGFKSNMSGGGHWSEDETIEYNRLTQAVEQVKADIEGLTSTMNEELEYVYYYKEEDMNKLLEGDEDYFINKYKEKIEEYENYFKNNNCENLLKEGGRKSRRNRRKSKKRKSRRRKKRTRRRRRKKR